MTAPLPPYRPSSPSWMAGYEHALRQAAEIAASEPEPEGSPPPELAEKPARVIAVASVRATKRGIAARIRAMRPVPPRVSPGMEPTPYKPSAVDYLGADQSPVPVEPRPFVPGKTVRAPVFACAKCDAVWRTEWQRDACCTAEAIRVAPTTLHERVEAAGLFHTLTPAQQAAVLAYDGPESIGERVQAAGGRAVAQQGTDALCGQPRGNEGVVG